MSDSEKPVVIHGIEASADGQRNAYSARCDALGQVMNYAACLWRQGVLSKPDIKTPTDWEPCRQAASCGKCNAVEMRNEELLKGHSIYFRDRNIVQRVLHTAREWVMPSTTRTVGTTSSSKHSAPKHIPIIAPKPRVATSMLDAMGDAMGDGGYADVINSVERTVSSEPAPHVTPHQPPAGALKALPGESPLAMARRMAAERNKSQPNPV
jgi:hypothetical protein